MTSCRNRPPSDALAGSHERKGYPQRSNDTPHWRPAVGVEGRTTARLAEEVKKRLMARNRNSRKKGRRVFRGGAPGALSQNGGGTQII